MDFAGAGGRIIDTHHNVWNFFFDNIFQLVLLGTIGVVCKCMYEKAV